jgi:hypothetical protein
VPLPQAPPNGFIPPCIPTRAYKVPVGPDRIHEVKHDGYRLQVRREGDAVRLFTRRGFDWTTRYPAIVRTALALPAKSFTMDGEAVVLEGTASRCSKTCTGAASSPRRCSTPSTCWNTEAKTCVRFPSPIVFPR